MSTDLTQPGRARILAAAAPHDPGDFLNVVSCSAVGTMKA